MPVPEKSAAGFRVQDPLNRLRLSLLILELGQETRKMGATSDLRAHLGNPEVKIRFGGQKKFVTMGDQTHEFDQNATNDQIAHALNLKKINAATAEPQMSFTGFQPGAIKAALATAKQKATADLTEAMGTLAEAQAKAAEVPAAIKQVAVQMKKEAEDALHEFAEFTNGAPE